MSKPKFKVKREMPEPSSSRLRDTEEHDLAYYIHDRVELMHQVISVIKPKELKSLAPDCVQHISIEDLQELCTEELLGISSKRLCAIMDGGEPPTDTETSNSTPEQLETISLDSISSDDEILSQNSSEEKKHKHRKRNKSKSKHKHRERKTEKRSSEERSRASRAGLTVLELLELQARARAIRAQLQQDVALKSAEQAVEAPAKASSDDDEVEIKEERAVVVEISSEEEKPNIQELEDKQRTATKRINDLVITVPQTKQPRKIKLNRNKVTIINNTGTSDSAINAPVAATSSSFMANPDDINKPKDTVKHKEDKKEKLKKKLKKKQKSRAESDHDEIMLQLSDTEKMDLLEEMDRKTYDIVTSSSDDSKNNSECDTEDKSNESINGNEEKNADGDIEYMNQPNLLDKEINQIQEADAQVDMQVTDSNQEIKSPNKSIEQDISDCDSATKIKDAENTGHDNIDTASVCSKDNTSNNADEEFIVRVLESDINGKETYSNIQSTSNSTEVSASSFENFKNSEYNMEICAVEEGEIANENQNLSEGEIVDHEDSQVPSDPKQEVVCISDEDNKAKRKKKNKKKDKKSKKEKKKKSDFREGADQNFYTDTRTARMYNIQTNDIEDKEILCVDDDDDKINLISEVITYKEVPIDNERTTDDNDQNKTLENKTNTEILSVVDGDNIINKKNEVTIINDEVFELSDDSSCFEVEGVSVLSKEPTTEEIKALSAKIDVTIDCEVTDKDIEEYDELQKGTEPSWKERYLDSRKVKQVLSTANILNALRKKNIELKKKLKEKLVLECIKTVETTKDENLEKNVPEAEDHVEGSVEQFNTLVGTTKYVDPVIVDKQKEGVSKEMEKDARQLLKMYKQLLKYNDMNRQKDPNKKKKKKHKKIKSKDKDGVSI